MDVRVHLTYKNFVSKESKQILYYTVHTIIYLKDFSSRDEKFNLHRSSNMIL